jgi:hypothetical protein
LARTGVKLVREEMEGRLGLGVRVEVEVEIVMAWCSEREKRMLGPQCAIAGSRSRVRIVVDCGMRGKKGDLR